MRIEFNPDDLKVREAALIIKIISDIYCLRLPLNDGTSVILDEFTDCQFGEPEEDDDYKGFIELRNSDEPELCTAKFCYGSTQVSI